MAAISPTLSFERVSPRPTPEPSTARRYWKWCVTTYHDHSDLITSLGIFTLNTILLASKIFKQIPHFIHRSCYVALSFSSVMWVNIQVRDLLKTGNDLYHSMQEKDMQGIVFTAAKVTVKSLNMLLAGSLMAASVVSLCAFPEVTLAMYAVMRPFSLFSLVVGIGTEIYDHRKNASLIGKFNRTAKNPEKVQRVMGHFLNRLYSEKDRERNTEKTLAHHTFRQLDHYVIETVKTSLFEKHGAETASQAVDSLGEQGMRDLFHTLRRGLKQKRDYTKANLGLIVLGYLSMGICKMWPDSLIQSSVTWGMSALYTGKMIWRKAKHSDLSNAAVLS